MSERTRNQLRAAYAETTNAWIVARAREAGEDDRTRQGRNGFNARRYGEPGSPGFTAYTDAWNARDAEYGVRQSEGIGTFWCGPDETPPDHERFNEDDYREER